MIVKGMAFFDIPCEAGAVEKLSFYITELARWNERVNLVGFKDMRSIVEVLLYDTFFLHGFAGGSPKTLDLGSGSGIIAIPLKILNPDMEMHAVDKSLRKIQFQRHIKRNLSLEGFIPVHGRAETVSPVGAESLVVKAFGTIQKILELGKAHLVEGGRAFILKGTKEEAGEAPGFRLEDIIPYRLPRSERRYRLFVYRKSETGETGTGTF